MSARVPPLQPHLGIVAGSWQPRVATSRLALPLALRRVCVPLGGLKDAAHEQKVKVPHKVLERHPKDAAVIVTTESTEGNARVGVSACTNRAQ